MCIRDRPHGEGRDQPEQSPPVARRVTRDQGHDEQDMVVALEVGDVADPKAEVRDEFGRHGRWPEKVSRGPIHGDSARTDGLWDGTNGRPQMASRPHGPIMPISAEA